MALMLLAGVAYATYHAHQSGQQEEGDDSEIDLEGKTPITLLPPEQTLGLLEAPMSTITYLNGDYMVAAEHLSQRVQDIIAKNPWVGGWVAKEKGGEIKLWYDETGKEVAPGTFRVYEPNEVKLYSDTPFEKYIEIAEAYLEATKNDRDKVKILKTVDLVGKNRAAWRVSIVPCVDKPDSKFVMIVSMSRILGDPRTFYQLYSMLNKDVEVYALNPKRRLECSEIAMEHFGREETYYIKNATTNPLWEWTHKEPNPTKILIFSISKDWLSTNMETEENDFEYPFLTSWFFNTLKPTVGMMPFDFRDELDNSVVTETDAGNYIAAIPLTGVDYLNPNLVQKALLTHKRCGSHPLSPLPGFQWDATFAFTNDWSKYLLTRVNFGDDNIRETMHLPLYDTRDLTNIPNKLSALYIFRLCPESEDGSSKQRLGAVVIAPRTACDVIESSSIVDEMIARF